MSLLLDALRRAEQDSRKRKLADAEAPVAAAESTAHEPVAAVDQEAPPELTLEAQSPVPELTLELPPEPAPEPAPAPPEKAAPTSHSGFGGPEAVPEASFLDFELPSDDLPLPEAVVPASLAPRKAANPYGRYDRPAWEDSNSNWGALIANPVASKRPVSDEARSSGPVPIKPVARKATEPVAEHHMYARPPEGASPKPLPKQPEPASPGPALATTPRQALSAAGVMAGRKKAGMRDSGNRRRQMLLGAAAVLVALPLVVFLLFGDAMFASPGGLGVVSKPVVPAPVAVSPAPPEPETATVAVVSPPAASPESVAPPMPALQSDAPDSPPVRAVPARAASADTVLRAAAPTRSPAPRSAPVRAARPVAAGTAAPSAVSGANRPVSQMDSAYAAYQAGNTVEAARLYREVLKADATQRDAWLGLAVIAHANNQLEPAMDAYRRVLRLEPQNATALAGVSSLSRAAGEPQQESRLRELLARSPQEADLNHALALVLSGEQRWSEAQPLFFKAHSLAPKEPQFAYNLAVALDHMRKSALAAQYYETALGLAQGKAAGFDEANARTRLAALRGAR
jgi:Flp pilus assembly protein TadD